MLKCVLGIVVGFALLFAAHLSFAQLTTTGAGTKAGGGGGGGTVVFDALGAESRSSVSVTVADNTNMTVGAALTGGALVAAVVQCDGGSNITGVTANWDQGGTPQAMTNLGSATSSTMTAVLLGRRNPTSGNKILRATWTNSAQVVIAAISFSGVNQASDAAAFKNFTSATNGTPQSVTVTSGSGHQVVAAFASSAIISSVNNNSWFTDNVCNTWSAAGNYANGSGSVTMTANPGSGTSLGVGVDVSP